MRAKSQNRDHFSLALRTRREQDFAQPPGCRGDFGFYQQREEGKDVNTSYCVCTASGGGGGPLHPSMAQRRVAHNANAKENASNRRRKPQFNSTESG